MKLEKQVCSLELAKKLKELGVPQESLLWWVTHPSSGYAHLNCSLERARDSYGTLLDTARVPDLDTTFSAYTVAELGQKLEVHYLIRSATTRERKWSVTVSPKPTGIGAAVCPPCYTQKADTEADARAALLIHLVENGLLRAN